jgi:hypothetical protein
MNDVAILRAAFHAVTDAALDALERRQSGEDNAAEVAQARHHANLMDNLLGWLLSKYGVPPEKAVPLVQRDLAEWGIWPAPDIEKAASDDGLRRRRSTGRQRGFGRG